MSASITRLVGVYDASDSMLGELSHFFRARLGRAHCALCDITHGKVRERNIEALRTAAKERGLILA